MIKWPNDIYANGKKLGGMLSEFSAKGRSLDYVVLGLGLNVNWKPSKEKVGRYPTTSILCETGRKIPREDLLVHILKRFESHYMDVQAGNFDRYYEKWNEQSMLLGRRVELKTSGGQICGKAIRTERNGALIVLDDQGQERKIVSGDVTVEGIGDESSGERATF
jgi:BirA family biotin operon repressor/biotin-[acetyl-CoA-carboxylase] ligase